MQEIPILGYRFYTAEVHGCGLMPPEYTSMATLPMLDSCHSECEPLLRAQSESLVNTLVIPQAPGESGVAVHIEFTSPRLDPHNVAVIEFGSKRLVLRSVAMVELRLMNRLPNAESAYQLLHLLYHLHNASLYRLNLPNLEHGGNPLFVINPVIVSHLSVAMKQAFQLHAKHDALRNGSAEEMSSALEAVRHFCRVDGYVVFVNTNAGALNATSFISGGGARTLKVCYFRFPFNYRLGVPNWSPNGEPNATHFIDDIVGVSGFVYTLYFARLMARSFQLLSTSLPSLDECPPVIEIIADRAASTMAERAALANFDWPQSCPKSQGAKVQGDQWVFGEQKYESCHSYQFRNSNSGQRFDVRLYEISPGVHGDGEFPAFYTSIRALFNIFH